MKRVIIAGLVFAAAFLSQPAIVIASEDGGAVPTSAATNDMVVFNWSNLKYHSPSCMWACRCTVHCINISRSEAHRRGGIPCKVCGGGE